MSYYEPVHVKRHDVNDDMMRAGHELVASSAEPVLLRRPYPKHCQKLNLDMGQDIHLTAEFPSICARHISIQNQRSFRQVQACFKCIQICDDLRQPDVTP